MDSKPKIHLLRQNLEILLKAVSHLDYSFLKCQLIDFNQIAEEDLVDLEAFSSRFGRVVDIYIKKIIRTILEIIKETRPTFLDSVHYCEKINLLSSADAIDKCRDMRNEIVHEYVEEDLIQLYQEMILIKPTLESNIHVTLEYINSNIIK